MRFDPEELFQFLRKYQADIILVIGVILISLLSFAIGFIVAKQQEKEPIKIEFRLQPAHHPPASAGPTENLESGITKVEEDSFFSIFAFAMRKLDV